MTRQEKRNYVMRDNHGEFILEDEQEFLKYKIMQDIVRLRREKGMTQDELAQRTGIARPNIARMENGSYNPTIEMLVRLAYGLDMRLEINWVADNKK